MLKYVFLLTLNQIFGRGHIRHLRLHLFVSSILIAYGNLTHDCILRYKYLYINEFLSIGLI